MNIVLPVLSLLLWQTGAPPRSDTTWPADFNASFSGGGYHQPQFYDGWQAGGDVGAHWYLRRPMVDDGSPLSMQAFLQRLDRLALSATTVGFSARDKLSFYEHRGHSESVALSGLFYGHGLVLGGAIYYSRSYDFQHPSPLSDLTDDERHTTQAVYPELTLGVRSGTFECDASYRYTTYFDDGKARSPRWGQAVLGLQDFFDMQTYWSGAIYTLVHGAGLSFDVEYFSSSQLGIWLKGNIESGVVYVNDQNTFNRKNISIGVGWWASNRLELQFSVGVSTSQQDTSGSSTLTYGFGTVGVVVRAPRRYRAQFVSPLADPLAQGR